MKLLIGGSPCTYWSIAQTKNRETEASGMGWELFRNYVIARDKYRPDYFLYENNKSMSAAIREQITATLGVEPVLINSALVSAQNRERLYWVGHRRADGTYEQVPVEQPEDKGLLLCDVLESGACWKEKEYCLTANYYKGESMKHGMEKHTRAMVAEPVCVVQRGRYTGEGGAVEQHFEVQESGKTNTLTTVQKDNLVAEPARIGTIESNAKNADFDSQQYRVYSPDGKSVTLCGNGGGVGAKTGLYATPIKDEKIGVFPNDKGELTQCQSKRIYSSNAKARVLNAGPGGLGVQTGLYAVPILHDKESGNTYLQGADGRRTLVYHVRDGQITIKGKQYPIKLADGCYVIRKLTVRECMRLQTVPETFEFPVSDSQSYKMLGNGWTVDVIAHIMSHFEGITTEPLDVLSMYDGMACGHIAMDKLGANIRNYYATEIDKYAIKTATHNFPDIVELGDAFQVRWDSVQA